MKRKQWFTVIGIYENNQRYANHVRARTPREAEKLAIKRALDGAADLRIAGVLKGKHKMADDDPSPEVAGYEAWEKYKEEMYSS